MPRFLAPRGAGPGSSARRIRKGKAACRVALGVVLAACAGGPLPTNAPQERTPLDDYVARPDPEFRFAALETRSLGDVAVHWLEMDSQRWRESHEVQRTLWTHWLVLYVPSAVRHSTALLRIAGGDRGQPAPPPHPLLAGIARVTGSLVAELRMVPNQPLEFAGEGRPRREDELIAYAWDRFLRTGDATWLPRLPMTKAAVRAMDAIEIYARDTLGIAVERFVVTGSSKRGWTAWTAAAADRRVAALIPVVIDCLNLEVSFRHHREVYGFWSPAIEEYVALGIPDWFGTQAFARLRAIVDPYAYRARYTMPKYVVNATGDAYFLPDSSRFYFADLPSPKYLRYVPNADHSLDGSDAHESIAAFYRRLLDGRLPAEPTWVRPAPGVLEVRLPEPPAQIQLWQATNPAGCDFRLETLGPRWESRLLKAEPGGQVRVRVPPPAAGCRAFLVEVTYAGSAPEEPPLKLTTEVEMLPAPGRRQAALSGGGVAEPDASASARAGGAGGTRAGSPGG